MQLLAEFLKEIFTKLVKWFKSAKKTLGDLLDNLKTAIQSFVSNLKKHLINASDSVFSTVATAIIGPVFRTVKKVWMLLKQGWDSLKNAVRYIKDPGNKGKPAGILLMEVGKIVIAGLTGMGALFLGEVIETGLRVIPVFAVEIPLLGSLANILGIFLGAVVAGIIGAIVINLIDKSIAQTQKLQVQIQIARQTEVVLKGQELNTLQKFKTVYETMGSITEKTISSLQESEERERNSFKSVEETLNKLRSI